MDGYVSHGIGIFKSKEMKTILTILILTILQTIASAQDVNWHIVRQGGKHLATVTAGADYSSYYGISYGYVIQNKIRPIVVGTELLLPFGKDFADDWKSRTSIQAELLKSDHFSLAVKPAFVVRRYESPLARMFNTAADITFTFGYLRPKFGINAIGSYDRSLATHIKHGMLKDDYPDILDGWYGSSGGNFKFGARMNFSRRSWNTFLTLGKHYGQDFRDNPTYPFFAELSIQKVFGFN